MLKNWCQTFLIKKKVCPSLLKLATLFKVEIKTKAGTSRIT